MSDQHSRHPALEGRAPDSEAQAETRSSRCRAGHPGRRCRRCGCRRCAEELAPGGRWHVKDLVVHEVPDAHVGNTAPQVLEGDEVSADVGVDLDAGQFETTCCVGGQVVAVDVTFTGHEAVEDHLVARDVRPAKVARRISGQGPWHAAGQVVDANGTGRPAQASQTTLPPSVAGLASTQGALTRRRSSPVAKVLGIDLLVALVHVLPRRRGRHRCRD